MFVVHLLMGFLLGQVITVEGFYIQRVLRYAHLLLFTTFLALFPLFLLLGILSIFGLERSPFVLLGIVLLTGQGILHFIHLFELQYDPHA